MRMRIISILILFVTIFIIHDGNGQVSRLNTIKPIFDQLPLELGLNQRTINCILQDRDGYMWIGTWSGLIRYDGYQTKVYTATIDGDKALKSNKITALLEDVDGNIWIGSRVGGLFKLDKFRDEFIQFVNNPQDSRSLSNNNVWSLTQGPEGKLWIGTENGINVLDPKGDSSFTQITKEDGLTDQFITHLYFDNGDNLWAATEYGINKISKVNGQVSIEKIVFEKDTKDVHLHNYTYQIATYFDQGREYVLVATKKGLKIIDDNNQYVSYELTKKSPSHSFFRCLYIVDTTNPFVLLGSEVGLNVFDLRKRAFVKLYENIENHINLSQHTIIDIYVDRTEVLWVGTKKGLNHYDTFDKGFEMIATTLFDPTRSTITGIVGERNEFWVSTLGGGLFHFKNDIYQGKYEFSQDQQNPFIDYVQTLHLDKSGHLWLGTAGTGAVTFDPKNVANNYLVNNYQIFSKSYRNNLSDDYVMSFGEEENGDLWVGTWSNGLNRIDSDNQSTKMGGLDEYPIVMLKHIRGDLWIGTRGGGVIQFDIETATVLARYSSQDGTLSNNFIGDIISDNRRNVWVATERGLNLIGGSDGKLRIFDSEDGFLSNEANMMIIDDFGTCWIGTFSGLTSFKLTDSTLTAIRHFDTEDRLQGGFFGRVSYKDDKGRLFFGGPDGLNIINPKGITTNEYSSEVIINDFYIFDKKVKIGESIAGRVILDEPIERVNQITLNHDENSMRFEFSSMHFAAPAGCRYKYFLEGFDKDWRETNPGERFATYTNLSDDNYVFHVKATNNDGVWNTNDTRINLTISPPIWKTPFSLFIYIGCLVLIMLGFRKLIVIRTNYINELKLERLQREGVEELNRTKLEFFTNISHEFRTPLTLILGPVETLLSSGVGGLKFKTQLSIIGRNTQRLLYLVNQLLDFRKIESNSIKLQVAAGNIVKFVQEIVLSFSLLSETEEKKLNFNASSNNIQVHFDRNQMEKVLFNLISNAFKYTSKGDVIDVKVIEDHNRVLIHVINSGVGLKTSEFEMIFNRFYSSKDSSVSVSTGIGLALTKSLVEAHHGSIEVDSDENSFTKFSVILQKGTNHFSSEEILEDFRDSEFSGSYLPLPQDESIKNEALLEGLSDDIDSMDQLLIVEDNDEVRRFIKSIFVGKYRLLEARDGLEGLELAQEEIPDLIISDVMMPKIDGITFCKEIKSNKATSHIPLILLTARTSVIFKTEGLEHGADDYITKPFNAEHLKTKVNNLLQLRKAIQEKFSNIKELVLEPGKIAITSSDEEFIKEAITCVEKNISNSEFTVEDLGREVGFSRMQLYRKLKGLANQTPNEFIRKLRLKRAAQLLKDSDLTVAEVTYSVGFNDLPYFRSCFKKEFGVNPSDFVSEDAV